jgi:glycyl-tRNA synthetase beta subunit
MLLENATGAGETCHKFFHDRTGTLYSLPQVQTGRKSTLVRAVATKPDRDLQQCAETYDSLQCLSRDRKANDVPAVIVKSHRICNNVRNCKLC